MEEYETIFILTEYDTDDILTVQYIYDNLITQYKHIETNRRLPKNMITKNPWYKTTYVTHIEILRYNCTNVENMDTRGK